MTNIDLLKQKLSLLASSGVLSDSAVNTIDEAVKALDELEPVVHCRDCRYWNEDYDCNCNIKAGWFRTEPGWYCADGKQRD